VGHRVFGAGRSRSIWIGAIALVASASSDAGAQGGAQMVPTPPEESAAANPGTTEEQANPEEPVLVETEAETSEMDASALPTPEEAVPTEELAAPELLAGPEGQAADEPLAPRARINGSFGVAGRLYFEEAPFPGQEVDYLYGYVFGTLDAEYRFDEDDRFEAEIYARGTPLSSYSLIDAREFYYLHTASTWDFLLGIDTVAWGVVESRDLVDIINQRDLGGNLDDDENRLGQPMANLNLISPDLGTLSLYGLFGFRERDFPEKGDRIRQSFIVSEDNARFAGDDWERYFNGAARYTNSYNALGGGLDIGLSYFHGLDREPRLEALPSGRVIPVYDPLDQVGVEALYAYDNVLLKFEGLSRWQNDDQFFAAVSGVEYTLHDVLDGAADVGLLAEYLFDDRSEKHPVTPFEDDVFVGVRSTLNNVGSTRMLAGAIVDVDDQSTFGSLEFEHRLRDDLLLSLDARTFLEIPAQDPFSFLNDESFLEIALEKYF
jgi:hypothetical protein